jgi:hypothetical protein
MIKFKEYFLESVDSEYRGPWFHGGTYSGNGNMKISKRGGFGWGIYFTDDRTRAEGYAKENGWGEKHTGETYVHEFYVRYKNPLIVSYKNSNGNGVSEIDVLVALGINREKAIRIVDVALEKSGYISKQIYTLATKMGYDALIIEYPNSKELIAWNPYDIKKV